MGFFTNLFKSKQKAPVIETSAKQNVEIKNEVMQKNLQNAVELDIDLVEASYFRGCCGECAKYRGRWFSISGKDKRFPKMPVDYGCTCMGIDFSPVIFGLSEPMLSDEIDDIITYSNRPFVDDRNDEELEIFNTDRKRLENEEFYEPYKEHWEAIRKYDHQQYDRLCQELPQLAPKSYSGYMAKAKQLPSGSWRVRVYDNELKKYLSFTSKLEGKAGKNEAELLAREYQLGRKQKRELGRTVGECIDEYITLKENILSPTTIDGYRKEKRNSLVELCEVPLKKLTPTMIQAHVNKLALTKSPKTIRNAHGLLVSVLNVYAPDMRINTTLPKQQKKIKQLPHVEDVMRAVVGTEIQS